MTRERVFGVPRLELSGGVCSARVARQDYGAFLSFPAAAAWRAELGEAAIFDYLSAQVWQKATQ